MVSSELIAVAAFASDGNGPAFATVSDQEVSESGCPATDADGTTFHIRMARGYVRDVELDPPDGTLSDQFEEGVSRTRKKTRSLSRIPSTTISSTQPRHPVLSMSDFRRAPINGSTFDSRKPMQKRTVPLPRTTRSTGTPS
jgi:hypothetical protein